MSWKAIAGSIIFVLILLAGSNFVNWKITSTSYYNDGYNDGQSSIVQDSTRADTVRVPYPDPFPVYIEREIEAETDTIDSVITYSAKIDTTVMKGGDTVAVITQDLYFTEGIFKTLMEIEIRPVERLVLITKTTFSTVPVFVNIDPPFYNTTVFGIILVLAVEVMLAIAVAIASL